MNRPRLGRIIGAMLLGAAVLAVVSTRLAAYALIGSSWPTGNITMTLQLDATAPTNVALPLQDGSASWNAVAQSAMADWNNSGTLVRSQLTGVASNSKTTKEGDGINSVFFSSTVYDSTFDNNVLAVTLVDSNDASGIPTVRTREADLIVNNSRTWNSYRGPYRSTPVDLRRVLVHELGHVLGLDHPDLATPPQTVTSIMNSTISNLETVQADDISGISHLYGQPLIAPTITQQPVSQVVNVTGTAAFTIGVNGSATPPDPAPALLEYQWYFKAAGATAYERLFTLSSANLTFGTAQTADAGSYYLVMLTPDAATTVTTNTVTLTVNPIATTTATSLANLSTRAMAGSSNYPLIVGFAVTGSRAKTILLRAIGPTLGNYGVSGTLPDPQLTLQNQDTTAPASGISIVSQDPASALVRDTSSRVGAFPAGPDDAVTLATVSPGTYSAVVSSKSGRTGVVLLEAYDADPVQDPSNRLVNLSTRGYVGTADNVLIAGFVVNGPGPHTYLVRVAGPTLSSYGVTNTLYDPMLQLHQLANNTSVLLRQTDDWDSPKSAQPALQAAFDLVHAFPLSDRKESAMLVTLPPGTYSAEATGNDNGGTTSPVGNAIIEIYELP